MARTTRARAQPTAALIATRSSSTRERGARLLVLRAVDEVDNLRDVLRAYVGLEKMIEPSGADDKGELHSTRNELSALMRLLNADLHLRIEAADTAIQSAREVLGQEKA